jgi:cell fate regulator YaaT (PSP1 superfamily)
MSEAGATKRIVAIRFQPLGKLYYYDSAGETDLRAGDQVLVMTSRGRELGEVVFHVADPGEPPEGTWKPIERRATAQELVMRRMWQRRELEAMIDCRAKAAEIGLHNIKVARAEYSHDGSRLTFLFSTDTDDKVDLKDLRKEMQKLHRKSQVELRQVGPRDVAKILGGMGACGLEERCCSRFLTEFSPISIKMAKAQGISLNPQEITGMCGRLRCCLVYEYEQYVEARKYLPKRNKRIVTPLGEAKVIDALPLKDAVLVLTEDGRRVEFKRSEIQPLDELKALEAKAAAPCPKHGSGPCNCAREDADGQDDEA